MATTTAAPLLYSGLTAHEIDRAIVVLSNAYGLDADRILFTRWLVATGRLSEDV